MRVRDVTATPISDRLRYRSSTPIAMIACRSMRLHPWIKRHRAGILPSNARYCGERCKPLRGGHSRPENVIKSQIARKMSCDSSVLEGKSSFLGVFWGPKKPLFFNVLWVPPFCPFWGVLGDKSSDSNALRRSLIA